MINPFSWFMAWVMSILTSGAENEPNGSQKRYAPDRRELDVPVAHIISIAGTPKLPQDDIDREPITLEEVVAELQNTPDHVDDMPVKKPRHPRTGHLADVLAQHS